MQIPIPEEDDFDTDDEEEEMSPTPDGVKATKSSGLVEGRVKGAPSSRQRRGPVQLR